MLLFIKKQKQNKTKTPKTVYSVKNSSSILYQIPRTSGHSVNKCSIVSMFNLQNLQRGESINLI